MKIAIDISEAVNGYRLDIIDQDGTHKENIERWGDVLLILGVWLKEEMRKESERMRGV